LSGWDQVRRAKLSEPWDSFWLDLFEDPPIGAWIDLQAAVAEALSDPTPGPIGNALAKIGPLVAKHNVTDRDGRPLAFTDAMAFPGGLYRAIVTAIMRELGGASAVPLSVKKASSPARSSRAKRSRRASPSGA
jgi:hypothetical protein